MRNPKWHRDEIILALDLYFDEERGTINASNPKIINLSKILNKLPIFDTKPDENLFRNPNGVNLKLSNFLALDPNYSGKGMQSYSKLDKEVFDEFFNNRKRLREIARKIINVVENVELRNKVYQIEDDEISELDSVSEGLVIYKLHKVRERDNRIINEKKKIVSKEKGCLKCEICGFDFEETYGNLGKGFIECHHLKPLSDYDSERVTEITDLALLCSNCHKMIHRDLTVSSVEDFREKWTIT
ncbi:MAG: HNH endonuclease [Bacteroidales bacterium]|jgi:5-methylcytosine-specific restriction protein A|nr:HNH endonuclease [Bacteroidales bacterium]